MGLVEFRSWVIAVLEGLFAIDEYSKEKRCNQNMSGEIYRDNATKL